MSEVGSLYRMQIIDYVTFSEVNYKLKSNTIYL